MPRICKKRVPRGISANHLSLTSISYYQFERFIALQYRPNAGHTGTFLKGTATKVPEQRAEHLVVMYRQLVQKKTAAR